MATTILLFNLIQNLKKFPLKEPEDSGPRFFLAQDTVSSGEEESDESDDEYETATEGEVEFPDWEISEKEAMEGCINTSSYFAHSENVLAAMLADYRKEFREEAVAKIQQIRASVAENTAAGEDNEGVRLFIKPVIDWDQVHTDYRDFLNGQELLEPPVTKGLDIEELKLCIEDPNHLKLRDFPLHTQAVERYVKKATEIVGSKTTTSVGLELVMSNAIVAWMMQNGPFKKKGDWVSLDDQAGAKPSSTRTRTKGADTSSVNSRTEMPRVDLEFLSLLQEGNKG